MQLDYLVNTLYIVQKLHRCLRASICLKILKLVLFITTRLIYILLV